MFIKRLALNLKAYVHVQCKLHLLVYVFGLLINKLYKGRIRTRPIHPVDISTKREEIMDNIIILK